MSKIAKITGQIANPITRQLAVTHLVRMIGTTDGAYLHIVRCHAYAIGRNGAVNTEANLSAMRHDPMATIERLDQEVGKSKTSWDQAALAIDSSAYQHESRTGGTSQASRSARASATTANPYDGMWNEYGYATEDEYEDLIDMLRALFAQRRRHVYRNATAAAEERQEQEYRERVRQAREQAIRNKAQREAEARRAEREQQERNMRERNIYKISDVPDGTEMRAVVMLMSEYGGKDDRSTLVVTVSPPANPSANDITAYGRAMMDDGPSVQQILNQNEDGVYRIKVTVNPNSKSLPTITIID